MTATVPPRGGSDSGPQRAVDIGDDGFCIRAVADPGQVDRLLERFAALEIDQFGTVYRSFANESRADARAIHEFISSELADAVDELAPGYRIRVGTYVHKVADEATVIDYHQDWTFTDERTHKALMWWIPLVDTTEESGTLAVIPRSQHWTDRIRTSSKIRKGPTVPHQAALEDAAVPVPLSAGTAIVYDPALLHGSAPNRSASGRPAIILITTPDGAPMVHFAETENGLEGWQIDPEYFLDAEFESLPTRPPDVEPWTGAVTPSDFDTALGTGSSSSETEETQAASAPEPPRRPWYLRWRQR